MTKRFNLRRRKKKLPLLPFFLLLLSPLVPHPLSISLVFARLRVTAVTLGHWYLHRRLEMARGRNARKFPYRLLHLGRFERVLGHFVGQSTGPFDIRSRDSIIQRVGDDTAVHSQILFVEVSIVLAQLPFL